MTTLQVMGAAFALSATPSPTPSPTPSALPEIVHVVTPDRQDELARRATRTVYIVTKNEMIAHGYASVADALTRIPGVVVERYGGAGSLANVFVRGAASDQTLVLLDGRPAAGAQSGTLDLGSFSTTGVERIEVVEGGGSTLYGSASIGGIINVITGPGRGVPNVDLYAGAFGDRAIDIEAGPLSLERRYATNDYSYLDPVNGSTQTRTNSAFGLWNGRLSDGVSFGAFRLDGSAGISSSQLGVPGSLSFLSATNTQNTTTQDLRATLTHTGAASRTSLALSTTRQTLLFYGAASSIDPGGCGCNDVNVESQLQLQLRNVVNAKNESLVYGVDLAHGSARIDAGEGVPPTLGFAETAIYAQETIDLVPARIYGGLRAERDGGFGGSLDPAFGATIALAPELRLKANYATAFRVPTIVDLAYPGFSNPNLVPERTRVADASLVADPPWGELSAGWFTTAGSNLISVNPNFNFNDQPGPNNLAVVNLQHASIAGLALDLATNPVRGISARLGVTDLYRALDLTAEAFRLPLRPVFSVTLGLNYEGPPRSPLAGAWIGTRSVGARPTNFAPPPGEEANAYTVMDAFARLRLAPNALLTLRAYNMLNQQYEDVPGYPSPGRAFLVELSSR